MNTEKSAYFNAACKALDALTSDELLDLKQLIDIQYHKKYDEEEPAREARWKQEADTREAQRLAEETARPARIAFLKSILKVGDRVKFTGCKDGYGIRIIENIYKDRDVITGWQMYYDSPTDTWLRNDTVTTNGIEKITQIFKDGIWVRVKDLMND